MHFPNGNGSCHNFQSEACTDAARLRFSRATLAAQQQRLVRKRMCAAAADKLMDLARRCYFCARAERKRGRGRAAVMGRGLCSGGSSAQTKRFYAMSLWVALLMIARKREREIEIVGQRGLENFTWFIYAN